MKLMNGIVFTLLAVLVNAEEQKRGDSTLLTLTNDNSNSKQNKRDASIIGSHQNHLLGGYSPLSISSSYPLTYAQPVSQIYGKAYGHAYPVHANIKVEATQAYPQQRVSYAQPIPSTYAQYSQPQYQYSPQLSYSYSQQQQHQQQPITYSAQGSYAYPAVSQPNPGQYYVSHTQAMPYNPSLNPYPISYQPQQPIIHQAPVATFGHSSYGPNYYQKSAAPGVGSSVYTQSSPNSVYQQTAYQPSYIQQAYPVIPKQYYPTAAAPLDVYKQFPAPSTTASTQQHHAGGVSYSSFTQSAAPVIPFKTTSTPLLSAHPIYVQPQYQPQPAASNQYQQNILYTPSQYSKVQYSQAASPHYQSTGSVHYGSHLLQPSASINKITYAQPTAGTILEAPAQVQQKLIYH